MCDAKSWMRLQSSLLVIIAMNLSACMHLMHISQSHLEHLHPAIPFD